MFTVSPAFRSTVCPPPLFMENVLARVSSLVILPPTVATLTGDLALGGDAEADECGEPAV